MSDGGLVPSLTLSVTLGGSGSGRGVRPGPADANGSKDSDGTTRTWEHKVTELGEGLVGRLGEAADADPDDDFTAGIVAAGGAPRQPTKQHREQHANAKAQQDGAASTPVDTPVDRSDESHYAPLSISTLASVVPVDCS